MLEKKIIEEAVQAVLGDSFVGFDAVPDDPRSCYIGVLENFEDSAWRGKWTECLRKMVREKTPTAQCVCVKPLPVGKEVWYSVDVL